MKEKVLTGKKHGMLLLVTYFLLDIVAIGLIPFGVSENAPAVIVLAVIWLSLGWIMLLGLKVLKPQEALVLTLFGKYYGTLKGEGFYAVNPFCVSVNPAAKTELNQSGDVKSAISPLTGQPGTISMPSNKLSLKILTLNNNRQKINDRLGTPVEIGMAVTWCIDDTAKAVFNVHNYKEYLSLQCDTALRNIVRIYPYDVAEGVDTTGDGVADEGSLRGSSEVVAARIREEIEKRVSIAGLHIIEARITYLAYAPEIAAAASAGVGHHRRKKDDRRRCRRHGGNGS